MAKFSDVHDAADHTGLTGVPDLSAHTGDTSDAHDASAISVLDTAANFTGTDVEAVLAELQDNIDGVSGGSGPATVRIGSNVTNSTTSFADVTGLSFAVTNGTNYAFDFWIKFSTPAATTGIALGMNGPTASIFAAQGLAPTGGTSVEGLRMNGYDSGGPTSGNTGTAVLSMARIWGILTPSADGTLIVRFASEVGSSTVTVYAGSCGVLHTL